MSQAESVGQSPRTLQPHLPPTHAEPLELPVQFTQAFAPMPHVVADGDWQFPELSQHPEQEFESHVQMPFLHSCPVRQLPAHVPASQQPPLHGVKAEVPHLVPHWCVVVLHASPEGQSVAAPHPQEPFTHLLPNVLFVQSTQAAPLVPQAVDDGGDWQLSELSQHPPEQEVPLQAHVPFTHVWPALQLDLHVPASQQAP